VADEEAEQYDGYEEGAESTQNFVPAMQTFPASSSAATQRVATSAMPIAGLIAVQPQPMLSLRVKVEERMLELVAAECVLLMAMATERNGIGFQEDGVQLP